MSLGVISKITLGLAIIIIATIVLFYLKVFIKSLENENKATSNKEEMIINRERGGGEA
jgi:uncharacterized membrane protein